MALTESNMMALGTPAPAFSLPDTVSGNVLSLEDLKGEVATVIVFICNHCPYVLHINEKLVEVANIYQEKGIQFIAISSNDAKKYPQDAPHLMTKAARELNYPFPYLYDETQEVAKAYTAACTPDFFVFDGNLNCAYRGRFDETRPNLGKPTGIDIAQTLDALITGEKVNEKQYPAMGCNIKWK